MYKGYKGVKLTKRLERYIGYAKTKYEKLSIDGKPDLWEVLNSYDLIMQQPKHMQMFLYDMICDQFIHHGEYSVVRAVDGELYVRKLNKCKKDSFYINR